MNRPPDRDQDTRELIHRFETERARRKRRRLVLAVIGGAAFLLVIGVATAWAVGALRSDGSESAGADSTVAAGSDGTPASGSTQASGGTSTTAATDAADSSGTDTTSGAGVTSATGSGTTGPPTTGPQTNTSETNTSASTTTSARTTSTKRTTTTAARTTTTKKATTTTSAAPPPPPTAAGSSKKIVVIDPGHQAKGDSSLEPVGPGSSQKKAKVSSGTAGTVTGIPESKLVLAVGLKLRDKLEAAGVKVVMTRTKQDVNISNIERAKIANEASADLFVRVHADGSDNPDVHGIHVLYPASIEGWTEDIAAPSKKVAQLAQKELVAATGAKDRGIDARDDMTGFNWSDVPAIIPEIGFMTNPAEDKLLATDAYQDKIVKALARAILSYLGID
jgi:N-acetylmuramoyl-L-alanine amidase